MRLVGTLAANCCVVWRTRGRGRGVLREGDLRFYDDLAVAGPYQRVYFRDRYYTRRALQTEVAYRQTLTKNLALGVWNDASVFDATSSRCAVLANGLGASAHLTVAMVAIDLYYGWGFSTDHQGPAQNLSLYVNVVY